MKITRRLLAFLLLACPLAALVVTGAAQKSANTHYLALVGTYTNKTTSKGIYAFDFDSATGQLTLKGVAAETPDPSWVTIHPNGKFVYAANESGKQSTVTAFSLDPAAAKLTQLNQLPAEGEDPCYLSFDKTGKFLFAANYTSGNVVVFPILPDGKLGPHTALIKDPGTLGPNKERQEGPHAHWVRPGQGNDVVYVADLGVDRVFVLRFGPGKGDLDFLNAPESIPPDARIQTPMAMLLPAGSGPRHADFSPDGRFLYVAGELSSTVTVFANRTGFSNPPIQTVSMLPSGFSGRNDAAEIAVHPGGKWLFASNRGHDSIAVFSVDPATGKLQSAGDFPTGGQEPRHFAIDPTGHFLLAENENSNSIVTFRIDPATGALTQVSRADNIPSPVCLVFLGH